MIGIGSIYNFLRQWTLVEYRTADILDLLDSIGAPLESTLDSLKQLEADSNYLLSISFETIALEHYLNDLYDPYLRRIQIDTSELKEAGYLFLESENRTLPTDYRAWNSGTGYTSGDRVERFGSVYEASSATTGDEPELNPSKWTFVEDTGFIDREDGYESIYSFTVFVPETYDAASNYDTGDLSFHEDALYIALEDGITGVWDPTKWSNFNNDLRKRLNKYIGPGRKYNIKNLAS